MNSIRLYNALLIGGCLMMSGCQSGQQENEIAGEAQGTTYHIKFVMPAKAFSITELHAAIEARFADLEQKLSNYNVNSEISRINQQNTTDWIPVSAEIMDELAIAQQMYILSSGCYDVTVKPLFDLWGFSRHEGKVPDDSQITATLKRVGGYHLELDIEGKRLRKKIPGLQIDLSSIAQGYSVGQIAQMLESHGVADYLAEIGGEMKVKGHKPNGDPWRVAIEKPVPNTREVEKILTITQETGTAIMTSGTYRNFFEESGKSYSHILDPTTGRPINHHLLSTTVLHPDPTWADAWSTTLLCLGETRGMQLAEQENIKTVFIYSEGNTLKEQFSSAFIASQ